MRSSRGPVEDEQNFELDGRGDERGGLLGWGVLREGSFCVIVLAIFPVFRYRRTMYLDSLFDDTKEIDAISPEEAKRRLTPWFNRSFSKSRYFVLSREYAAINSVERRTEYTESLKKEFFTMPDGQVWLFVSPAKEN